MYSYDIEYQSIMKRERALWQFRNPDKTPQVPVTVLPPKKVRQIVDQLFTIGRSSLEPRGYIELYELDPAPRNLILDQKGRIRSIVHESIGAHTNLLSALVDRAIFAIYGPDFGKSRSKYPETVDNFSYREIMETIRIHALPENVLGDLPCDNDIERKKKDRFKDRWLTNFSETYREAEQDLHKRALVLFRQMRDRTSPTGRMLYLADKVSTILMTFVYESLTTPSGGSWAPERWVKDPTLSADDQEKMSLCEGGTDDLKPASELWNLEFFQTQDLVRFDESGFFTSILVMATLMFRGEWYGWRERAYMATRSNIQQRISFSFYLGPTIFLD